MGYKILVINPGSTSTKLAIFDGKAELACENIEHAAASLAPFGSQIAEQTEMRMELTLDFLQRHGYTPAMLDLVMCRGGMLPPVHSGGYIVDEAMLDYLKNGASHQHASNLGALIGHDIAQRGGHKAYI